MWQNASTTFFKRITLHHKLYHKPLLSTKAKQNDYKSIQGMSKELLFKLNNKYAKTKPYIKNYQLTH